MIVTDYHIDVALNAATVVATSTISVAFARQTTMSNPRIVGTMLGSMIVGTMLGRTIKSNLL